MKQLSEPFEMSSPAISKHLRVLERAGLVSQGSQAQWRPCRLEVAPLEQVADWTEDYRRFWEESFDSLGEYLAELQGHEASAPNPEPPRARVPSAARKSAAPRKRASRARTSSPGRKPKG